MTEQAKLILSLLQLQGVGRKTVKKYLLPGSSASYNLDFITEIVNSAHSRTSRVREYSSDEITSAMKAADHIIAACNKYHIKVVSLNDPDFPTRLKQIDDPPVLLYYRGNINLFNENKTIAIIGTREPTNYGYRIAERIGETMTESGIVTVSGLALGCDTGGHTGSVNKNGYTSAILANGLDVIYPKENQKLASNILELGGCIISEYPPCIEVQRGFFVDRDRLQAALSDAVFVVETDIRGGTMHTVEFAEKYGKQVYCFNQPQKFLSEPKTLGNQKLIREGVAKPIYSKEELKALISAIITAPIRTKPNQHQPEQLSLL